MNVHAKIPADGAVAYAKGYGLMQNPHPPMSVLGERWIRDWRWQRECSLEPDPSRERGSQRSGSLEPDPSCAARGSTRTGPEPASCAAGAQADRQAS